MLSRHSLNLSRRSLLAGVCGGAAATLFPHSGYTADTPQPIPLRLGLVTYNWGKDWSIDELIRHCSATGFSGVELRSTHRHGVETRLTPAQREEVRGRFADSDVELMGLGSACEYHAVDPAVVKRNIEETKEFIHLCHDVGASGVKVRPNGLPKEVPVARTLEQIGKALNEVASYGADYGVQIRLEVHGAGTSELPHVKTIMDIADHPGNVICWNCNPQDLQGDGFAHNYELVEDRMGTVHIHDLRKQNYPWTELFARLRVCTAPAFTGWTLIEEGGVPDDIPAAMSENHAIWKRLATG